MKLLVLGRAGPVAIGLAVRAVRELAPDSFLQLTRTGLSVPAAAAAAEAGVPVKRYWPDFLSNRSEAIRIALEQMLIHEGPFLTLVISPRDEDEPTIQILRELGVKVVMGTLGKDRQVQWSEVPCTETIRTQVLPSKE